MYSVILLLGSNEGDRLRHLSEAKERIAANAGEILKASSIYESEAWGKEEFPPHLNQALVVDTNLEPMPLLRILQAIEEEMGRKRLVKWGMRNIDIDIIYFENFLIHRPGLDIPHPLMHQRRFVLVPVCELTPNFIHPLLQKSNKELLAEVRDPLKVTYFSAS